MKNLNRKVLDKFNLNSLQYYPFIKYNILKKFFKFRKKKKLQEIKKINIFKLSIIVFSFLKKNSILINMYNGKKLISFNISKLKIFLIIGEFITTRIINSGKILHKRKKK